MNDISTQEPTNEVQLSDLEDEGKVPSISPLEVPAPPPLKDAGLASEGTIDLLEGTNTVPESEPRIDLVHMPEPDITVPDTEDEEANLADLVQSEQHKEARKVAILAGRNVVNKAKNDLRYFLLSEGFRFVENYGVVSEFLGKYPGVRTAIKTSGLRNWRYHFALIDHHILIDVAKFRAPQAIYDKTRKDFCAMRLGWMPIVFHTSYVAAGHAQEYLAWLKRGGHQTDFMDRLKIPTNTLGGDMPGEYSGLSPALLYED